MSFSLYSGIIWLKFLEFHLISVLCLVNSPVELKSRIEKLLSLKENLWKPEYLRVHQFNSFNIPRRWEKNLTKHIWNKTDISSFVRKIILNYLNFHQEILSPVFITRTNTHFPRFLWIFRARIKKTPSRIFNYEWSLCDWRKSSFLSWRKETSNNEKLLPTRDSSLCRVTYVDISNKFLNMPWESKHISHCDAAFFPKCIYNKKKCFCLS